MKKDKYKLWSRIRKSLDRFIDKGLMTDDEIEFARYASDICPQRDYSVYFMAGYLRGLRAASNNKFEPTRKYLAAQLNVSSTTCPPSINRRRTGCGKKKEFAVEEKKYHKCNKEQGFCPTLRARVKSSGESGYGMFSLAVPDLFENTGTKNAVRVIGVNYKESAKDRGVMFNYCPYCGEKIDWFREGREEKE